MMRRDIMLGLATGLIPDVSSNKSKEEYLVKMDNPLPQFNFCIDGPSTIEGPIRKAFLEGKALMGYIWLRLSDNGLYLSPDYASATHGVMIGHTGINVVTLGPFPPRGDRNKPLLINDRMYYADDKYDGPPREVDI